MPISRTILEHRRLRAYELMQRGWRATDIAAALGVSKAAVSQWAKVVRDGGRNALASRKAPGAASLLTERHRKLIGAMQLDPPTAFGLQGDRWTRQLMQMMIKRLFGIRYSLQHVGRLMKATSTTRSKIPQTIRLELEELVGTTNIAAARRRMKTKGN